MTDINAVIERLEGSKRDLISRAMDETRRRLDSGKMTPGAEAYQLAGKIEGIRLALSYLREEQ